MYAVYYYRDALVKIKWSFSFNMYTVHAKACIHWARTFVNMVLHEFQRPPNISTPFTTIPQ